MSEPNSWCWYKLSIKINPIWVLKYPHLPWNKSGLSRNKRITWSILKLKMPNATRRWNIHYVSQNIPISEVLDHPKYTWSKIGLSNNKGITIAIVNNPQLQHCMGDWDFRFITRNVPLSDISEYKDILIERCLAHNRNITLDLIPDALRRTHIISKWIDPCEVLINPTFPWSRPLLSGNRRMTIDYYNLINLFGIGTGNWNWSQLTISCPLQDIQNNPHLSWDRRLVYTDADLPNGFGETNEYTSGVLSLKRVHPFPFEKVDFNIICCNKNVTIPDLYAIINTPIPFPPTTMINSYYDIQIMIKDVN